MATLSPSFKPITSVRQLEILTNKIRQTLIQTLLEAKSGHSAGPLDTAELFTALYFNILNHNPKNPNWEDRDRLVLSCGHITPIRYVVMAYTGYFPKQELLTLRKFKTRLQGHPHNLSLPGVETTGGPLGQGLSQAIGMALAAKLDNKKHRIYCIMSDGEQEEGQTWEAVMSAAKYRLDNLTAFIDRNNIQIDGYTEDVMPLDSLKEKYLSFNWNVIEIDGNNIHQILAAVNKAKSTKQKPTVIICHTIPGKGVSFMEYDYTWHGKPPNQEEAKKALEDLRTLGGRIHCGDHK